MPEHTNKLNGPVPFLRSWRLLSRLQKFPALYGTRGFIAVLIRSRHSFLSWTIIQPTYLRSTLTLFSHLRTWITLVLQIFQRISLPSHAGHTPHPSQRPWFTHPDTW